MEELIKRLFEELAKQTARAAFAEAKRDQYEEWYKMYQTKCEKLEDDYFHLNLKYHELDNQIGAITTTKEQKNDTV